MRAIREPNWWAASALVFCLATWSVGVAAVARTASLYQHRSSSGFRHDLMVRAEHRWTPWLYVTPTTTRR